MRNPTFYPAPDSTYGQTSEIPDGLLSKDPFALLSEFADGKYKDAAYQDILLETVIRKCNGDYFNHRLLFKYFDLYRGKYYGQELFEKALTTAKELRPDLLLEYYKTYKDCEGSVDIFADAADKCIRDGYTRVILENFTTIQSILSTSAENLLKQTFLKLAKDKALFDQIFLYIKLLETRPYAKEVLMEIAKADPRNTINHEYSWAHLPYADEIRAAAGMTVEQKHTSDMTVPKPPTDDEPPTDDDVMRAVNEMLFEPPDLPAGTPDSYGIPSQPEDDEERPPTESTAPPIRINLLPPGAAKAMKNFIRARRIKKMAIRYGTVLGIIAFTGGAATMVLELIPHKIEKPPVTKKEPEPTPPPKPLSLAPVTKQPEDTRPVPPLEKTPLDKRIETLSEAIQSGVLPTRGAAKRIIKEVRQISAEGR